MGFLFRSKPPIVPPEQIDGVYAMVIAGYEAKPIFYAFRRGKLVNGPNDPGTYTQGKLTISGDQFTFRFYLVKKCEGSSDDYETLARVTWKGRIIDRQMIQLVQRIDFPCGIEPDTSHASLVRMSDIPSASVAGAAGAACQGDLERLNNAGAANMQELHDSQCVDVAKNLVRHSQTCLDNHSLIADTVIARAGLPTLRDDARVAWAFFESHLCLVTLNKSVSDTSRMTIYHYVNVFDPLPPDTKLDLSRTLRGVFSVSERGHIRPWEQSLFLYFLACIHGVSSAVALDWVENRTTEEIAIALREQKSVCIPTDSAFWNECSTTIARACTSAAGDALRCALDADE